MRPGRTVRNAGRLKAR